MVRPEYDGRIFRSISNTANGEVGADTRFSYTQTGNVVQGTYAGGRILSGVLIAIADGDGSLDMRYAHVTDGGELMTGTCRSTPVVLRDGRIRMHERWRWTSGDGSAGESVIEEVPSEARRPGTSG